MKSFQIIGLFLLFCTGCSTASNPGGQTSQPVPSWVQDAVFYQIFPERFRNGDPTNDPVRESLENPEYVPESWAVSSWTDEWYARAAWEEEKSDDFYASIFDRRFGGDLQGVIDKLDYLNELGVNAIYFNPLFHARSLHKYDGSSFHHIDPYFGPDPSGDMALTEGETEDPASWVWTSADRLFIDLLAQAKDRGIRVVIDGVWNHTGRGFFAFADLAENQQKSRFTDWYIVNEFDDPVTAENEFAYDAWWGFESLPEFANSADGTTLADGPREYIFAATRRWMDPDNDGDPSDGIDGWRLDVAEDVPVGFWIEWNDHVRQINSEAYTVAEMWMKAAEKVTESGFSATMNYHAFAMPVKGFLIDGLLPASEFARIMEERRTEFSESQRTATLNLIDSHDTPRLASMVTNRVQEYEQPGRFDYDTGRTSSRSHVDYRVEKPGGDDRAIQRLVALFQLTYPGAPMIYYGTEAGMWGGDDPDDRMPMIWDDLQYDAQTRGPFTGLQHESIVDFDDMLHTWYKSAISLRKNHEALRSDEIEIIAVSDEQKTVVFSRSTSEEHLIVAINRSGAASSLTLEQLPHVPGREILLQTGPAPTFSDDGGMERMVLAPYSGVVFGGN